MRVPSGPKQLRHAAKLLGRTGSPHYLDWGARRRRMVEFWTGAVDGTFLAVTDSFVYIIVICLADTPVVAERRKRWFDAFARRT